MSMMSTHQRTQAKTSIRTFIIKVAPIQFSYQAAHSEYPISRSRMGEV